MAEAKSQSLTTPPTALPFADMDRLFNRMMSGWPAAWPAGWPFAWPQSAAGSMRFADHLPKIEVKENGKTYTVTVELPGLDENDIDVEVEDRVLSISGEKKVEHADDKTHFSERSYGSFTRSFTLPEDADANAVKAQFAKGVLSLEIGKSAVPPANVRKVPVAKA